MSLKLIKTGQVVESQILKNYYMNAAKELQLLNDQQLQDGKKLQQLRTALDKMLRSEKKAQPDNDVDYAQYFRSVEKRMKQLKDKEEESIINMFEEFTTYDKSRPPSTTSLVQKYLREIMHEIWS